MAVAKTRVRDRIVRRKEILFAAGRVFIRKGFRLATMEDIASAAEVGVGTLYHYFKSKEDLFASLLGEATQLLSDRLKAAAARPLPPGLGLLAINRAYVDYFAEYPDFFRIQMFFQHQTEVPREFASQTQKIQKLARQNFELLADKIREGQKAGLYRSSVDPMAAATALWASYNGIFLAATNGPMLEVVGLTVEQLLATAAVLHFTGLAADPKTVAAFSIPAGTERSEVSLKDLQATVRSAPWIDPAMIFAGMPLTFLPENARGIRETFEYRLSGTRGGVWSVRVDDGTIEVVEGASATPSVVFETSDENFIQMVTGAVRTTDLLTKGELKVSGDFQAAAMFRSFFVSVAPGSSA
ncbi:MAG: TetR family transcriptional regulator [Candidatus Binatia bacterium]